MDQGLTAEDSTSLSRLLYTAQKSVNMEVRVSTSNDSLEKRIAQLERKNLLLVRSAALVLIAVCCSLILGWSQAPARSEPLRVKGGLIIEDQSGQARVLIGAP